MRHSDEAVERVLAGLREAETPYGMNRRILERAQARAVEASSSRWAGMRSLVRMPARSITAWALACSIVVVTAVGISMIPRITNTSTQAKLQETLPIAPQPRSAEGPMSSVSVVGAKVHLQSSTMPKERHARAISNGDSATAREMQVSFPAPPMPLTDQEKLLLRIVHKRDPVEMAMLDPDVRSRQNAENKAEFQRFFEAPTRGDTK